MKGYRSDEASSVDRGRSEVRTSLLSLVGKEEIIPSRIVVCYSLKISYPADIAIKTFAIKTLIPLAIPLFTVRFVLNAERAAMHSAES